MCEDNAGPINAYQFFVADDGVLSGFCGFFPDEARLAAFRYSPSLPNSLDVFSPPMESDGNPSIKFLTHGNGTLCEFLKNGGGRIYDVRNVFSDVIPDKLVAYDWNLLAWIDAKNGAASKCTDSTVMRNLNKALDDGFCGLLMLDM